MKILGGLYKGMNLFVPKSNEVRPALARMKNSLFNILMGMFDNKDVLDLFAGTGNLGLEALSRGAKSCLLIENNRECYDTIQKNILKLKVEKSRRPEGGFAEAVLMDSFNIIPFAQENNRSFDFIFVDPPYKYYADTAMNQKLLKIIDDFSALNILNKEGLIIVEHRSRETKEEIAGLPHLKRIDIRNYGQTTLSFLAGQYKSS